MVSGDVREDNWAVANLLIGQYGTDAVAKAAERATSSDVDDDVKAIWRDVQAILSDRQSESSTLVEPL